MELIVAADPKKPDKLNQALESDLVNAGQKEIYEAIVLGINSDDLEMWAREVVSEKANSVKVQIELKKQQKKGKGFFGRVFGGKEDQKSAEE